MRGYLKYITYFSLSVLDSLVNLLCSLVGFYPALDTSGNYLVRLEINRLAKWNYNRQQEKINSQMESMSTINDVKQKIISQNL